MDLVQSYSGFLSTKLIQELSDLTSLVNLSGGLVDELLLPAAIRYSLNTFTNMITAANIMLTTAVSIASCERSFLKIKLLKTGLQTLMTQTG